MEAIWIRARYIDFLFKMRFNPASRSVARHFSGRYPLSKFPTFPRFEVSLPAFLSGFTQFPPVCA
jgi:hypothetical protein